MAERAVCFGPVKRIGYEYRECHGHVYAAADPKRLPEDAVGVRVAGGSEIQAFVFGTHTSERPIYIAPAHRHCWEAPLDNPCGEDVVGAARESPGVVDDAEEALSAYRRSMSATVTSG